MALNLVFVQGVWEHDVINTYADDLNWLFAMSTGYEVWRRLPQGESLNNAWFWSLNEYVVRVD